MHNDFERLKDLRAKRDAAWVEFARLDHEVKRLEDKLAQEMREQRDRFLAPQGEAK